jgi:uncharacterized protein (DUF488 family)
VAIGCNDREGPSNRRRLDLTSQAATIASTATIRVTQFLGVLPQPALLTIGCEGRTLAAYLELLVQSRVSLLCDVRRNPLSRKRGFSKKALARACTQAGIRYEHLAELGIASEKRKRLKTQADYDALFEDYERNWLTTQAEALGKIRSWLDAGQRVALTCFELAPEQCHRHCVAEALGGVVRHL